MTLKNYFITITIQYNKCFPNKFDEIKIRLYYYLGHPVLPQSQSPTQQIVHLGLRILDIPCFSGPFTVFVWCLCRI